MTTHATATAAVERAYERVLLYQGRTRDAWADYHEARVILRAFQCDCVAELPPGPTPGCERCGGDGEKL
jgi:hypothetical protein